MNMCLKKMKEIFLKMKTKKFVKRSAISMIVFFVLFWLSFQINLNPDLKDWSHLVFFVLFMINFGVTFFFWLLLVDEWERERSQRKREERYSKTTFWLRARKFNDQFVVWDILKYYGFADENTGFKFNDLVENSIGKYDFEKVIFYKEIIVKKINTDMNREKEKFFTAKKMLEIDYKKSNSFKYLSAIVISFFGYPVSKRLFLELTGFNEIVEELLSSDIVPTFLRIIGLYLIIIFLVYCLYTVIKNKNEVQRKNLIFIFGLVEEEICHASTADRGRKSPYKYH